jgi:hypothetical protein
MGALAASWLSIALVSLTSPPASTSDAIALFLLNRRGGDARADGRADHDRAALRHDRRIPAHRQRALEARRRIVGLGLCVLAVYAALAMALEDAVDRISLPLGRRRGGRDPLAGEPTAQVDAVEHAAGVRQQL